MRMRKVFILLGVLLLTGAGCRECNCGGGGQEREDQTSAPTIPQSNTPTQQNTASLPSQPVEASAGGVNTPQPANIIPANIRQTVPVPEVTEEELNDPRFNSNLPRASRRSLIISRKLQESGQIRKPNFPPSVGPHTPHNDKVNK